MRREGEWGATCEVTARNRSRRRVCGCAVARASSLPSPASPSDPRPSSSLTCDGAESGCAAGAAGGGAPGCCCCHHHSHLRCGAPSD